jgi:hypothetical protein
MLSVSGAVGKWCWLVFGAGWSMELVVYGVGWSLELVSARGVMLCVGLLVLAIGVWGVLRLLFCCRRCVIVACCSEVLCAMFCDVFGVLVAM